MIVNDDGAPVDDWQLRITPRLQEMISTWVRPIAEQIAAAFAANPELLAAIDRLFDQLPENWPRRGLEWSRSPR